MKIKINYDVIDKIQNFNRGYDLKRIAFANTISGLLTFLISSSIVLPISDHKISSMITIGTSSVFGTLLWTYIYISVDKAKSLSKSIAENKLQNLVRNLKKVQVHTNLSALQEAKVIKTSYKLKLDDQKKPFVKQDKYIQVCAYNSLGDQYNETLHQEHIIGTKDYDISVGEPEKKVQVKRKLARAM